MRAHAEMLENEILNYENTCRPWTHKVHFWISVVLHKSNKRALGTVKDMPCIILQAFISDSFATFYRVDSLKVLH